MKLRLGTFIRITCFNWDREGIRRIRKKKNKVNRKTEMKQRRKRRKGNGEKK